ncbi:ABC transporter permease [Acidimangrovimonas pyrenivorans]|uniref:FtsX-like permease family protein n=1 Tax=Acidimangrovimonas pyrenivorans TaxID=2030798 RepID=A0ABV7AG40_9RHOB
MMLSLWISKLARHRVWRLFGTVLGVALAVALVAALAGFLTASTRTMTTRAVASMPIDWQVEPVPGADPAKIRADIAKAAKVAAVRKAFYATTTGLQASTGGTVQTTGPGKVIAFGKDYLRTFPRELRLLSGTLGGPLLAQQTAANLHARPGDTVTINRPGLAPVQVTIAGVVDLPDADAFFQGVGLPKQAAPQAPPDNVVILRPAQWHRVFDPQGAVRPDSTRMQFHVRLDHPALPAQPTAAYTAVTGAAHNLEARVAGQALVANNLGARLDAVRGDGLYATVLFLFLGLPGVALAALLTFAVTASGGDRRRTDQSLLRTRGATRRQILSLAGAEALTVGAGGTLLGLALAALSARLLGLTLAGWLGAALIAAPAGLVLALGAVLWPAWRDLGGRTVSSARRAVGRAEAPLWRRFGLDLILLAGAAIAFWQSASTGYQIVLAPEGVPATAVDYKAFLAPALFWIGSALLLLRLSDLLIGGAPRGVSRLLRPAAGRLSPLVATALSRQSRRLTGGVAMAALALAFATSTAIFNTTYNGQALVDAELTNGADVTVFGTVVNPAGPHLATLAKVPGVTAAVPMMHRFAYVGADLQNIYGIRPGELTKAARLSNAYFRGASAQAILAKLKATPDGVLVSEETVKDFQLNPGDRINLRLMSGADHQYHVVPFHFIGVAREFPTAPKDSFLVANAAYIAKATAIAPAEYVLMKTSGQPARVAGRVRAALQGAPGMQVKDIGSVTHIIGSSLTSVDLSGLTRIELTFAILIAAASAGLMLALGFEDRKRAFAILTAVGAKPGQLAGFLRSEGLLIAAGGIAFGMGYGVLAAWMLVKLLTGVFDPPPETLAIPFGYLGAVVFMVVLSVAGAVRFARRRSRQGTVELLREL